MIDCDLRQQIYLFESISRFNSAHVSPLLARVKMMRNLGIAALFVPVIWYALWRRKKARPQTPGPTPDNRARERLMATSLYELLEGAMSAILWCIAGLALIGAAVGIFFPQVELPEGSDSAEPQV